jgi:pyruvate,orthophosphate dikinase
MMGLRGCRLGLVFPEIVEMQVRAILEAACDLQAEGHSPRPEIMIPLVGHAAELSRTIDILSPVADAVFAEKGIRVEYKLGTMIEVPRGALTADQIAEFADFFSFGTNDLTQTTFAYSRDDAEAAFLGRYLSEGILKRNPFQTLDREGVGALMRIAVTAGRQAKPGLEVGICGEHGGDPDSIAFCHELGLDYVSCSPFRVPVARLAAAQAALRAEAGAGAEERDL